MTTPTPPQEQPDFSLVLGGPFYQLLRRAHLAGPELEQLPRRILFFALITWLPLAVLSLIAGNPSQFPCSSQPISSSNCPCGLQ